MTLLVPSNMKATKTLDSFPQLSIRKSLKPDVLIIRVWSCRCHAFRFGRFLRDCGLLSMEAARALFD